MNKKNLTALSIVALLVLAPFVSYYYLRTGLEYRIDSVSDLEEKEVPTEIKSILSSNRGEGRAALFHLGSSAEKDVLMKLSKKVVDRSYFDVFSVLRDEELAKSDILQLPETSLDVQSPYSFVLVDSSGVVRNTYEKGTDHSKELIRHLAVVVPLPKNRNIELKREVDKMK